MVNVVFESVGVPPLRLGFTPPNACICEAPRKGTSLQLSVVKTGTKRLVLGRDALNLMRPPRGRENHRG